MRIISFSQGFVVVEQIQSCVYGFDETDKEWFLHLSLKGANGEQFFKTSYYDEESAKTCYEKIKKAVLEYR